MPLAASAPAASGGELYDNTHPSAIEIPRASSGESIAITGIKHNNSLQAGLYFTDRYLGCGGIDSTVVTSQTINTIALPARANNGVGAEIWLEAITAITSGPAAATAVVTYTNSAGVAGRQTQPLPLPAGTVRINTTDKMALQQGDLGVQSIQSIQLSAAAAAGTYGVIIAKRIVSIPAQKQARDERFGAFALNLPVFPRDACLSVAHASLTSSAPQIIMEIEMVPVTP